MSQETALDCTLFNLSLRSYPDDWMGGHLAIEMDDPLCLNHGLDRAGSAHVDDDGTSQGLRILSLRGNAISESGATRIMQVFDPRVPPRP